MGNCLGELRIITTKEAVDFLLPKHYSGRKPNISRAFGWYIDDELVAVCTFGKPASRTLCSGIMKGEYSECVYELNRLCRIETFNGQLSKFVGACLREVAKNNWIVVSYADTGMKHNGYIYQATNFYIQVQQKKEPTNIQRVINIQDTMIIVSKTEDARLGHLNTDMSILQLITNV